jgi:FdhE protein
MLHKKILQFRASRAEENPRTFTVTDERMKKAIADGIPLFFSVFKDTLDNERLNAQASALLTALASENIANRDSVEALKASLTAGTADIVAALERYFMSSDAADMGEGNPTQDLLLYFISRILIQNEAEAIARGVDARESYFRAFERVGHCLVCGNVPSIVLRETEEGEARNALLCDLCGSEYLVDVTRYCPVCCKADSKPKQLVVFPEYDGMSLEICEACRTYVKSIDRDKALVPFGYEDVLTSPLDDVVGQQARRAAEEPQE